jgi:hypothetical protein
MVTTFSVDSLREVTAEVRLVLSSVSFKKNEYGSGSSCCSAGFLVRMSGQRIPSDVHFSTTR